MTRGRQAVLVALALAVVLGAGAGPAPTWALFGDSSVVESGQIASGEVPAPTAPLGCTNLPNNGGVRISWSGPNAGSVVRFRLRLRVGSTVVATSYPTANSFDITPSLLGSLGGVHTVEVRTELLNTSWVSAVTARTVNVGLAGISVTCT